GSAGHGSMRNPDNAVTRVLDALSRIDSYQWPDLHHPVQEEFLNQVAAMWGLTIDRDDLESSLSPIGSLSRMVAACCAHNVTPTVLSAGYKVNVVPTRASAEVDARFIPGAEEDMILTIKSLAGPGIDF
ncbi:peptidase dimerization domain-containing protein, partial [Cutibacterium acnes subsp. acnes]|nr:peptidase dimerization domain-containing protein [Cutibacterium acnes subsp. acnes]